jgi:hypothetical protein
LRLPLAKFRQYLVETEQKVSESYDKTVITLSSGALGVSFAFLKDVIGDDPIVSKSTLLYGWSFLTASLASVVLSLFFATLAFRKSIEQIDSKTHEQELMGGLWSKFTAVLHLAGGALLIVGLVLLGMFLAQNL